MAEYDEFHCLWSGGQQQDGLTLRAMLSADCDAGKSSEAGSPPAAAEAAPCCASCCAGSPHIIAQMFFAILQAKSQIIRSHRLHRAQSPPCLTP